MSLSVALVSYVWIYAYRHYLKTESMTVELYRKRAYVKKHNEGSEFEDDRY